MTQPSSAPGSPTALPYLQQFSLTGKVALITGGARDIGLAIGRAMAGSGAHVILAGRDATTLASAVQGILAEGGAASALAFDVTDQAAVRNAFASIALQHGKLDILVNSAGVRHRKPLLEFSDEDIQQMLASNLVAGYTLMREAARLMTPQRSGRLISITSIAGKVARSGDAVYTGAKAGMTGMMRALAAEYGPLGITSNAIAPGGVATAVNAAAIADPAINQHFIARTPLGRWAQPAEIAGAAVFLASAAATYVNGHVLYVDGGMSIAM